MPDPPLQGRSAEALFAESGPDLRGTRIEPFYAVDITGASSVEVVGEHLEVTVWRPGRTERVVHKH